MNKTLSIFLFWSPRILGILFAIFISLFALDVFDEQADFWETTLALLMHLIPTAAIVIILLFSWKWEWIGGLFFNLLGIFYIVIAWGKFPLSAYFAISGPLFLLGILFLAGWFYRGKIRKDN